MVTPEQIKTWIEAGLNGSTAQVSGDGHHFEAVVVCVDFLDKAKVQRHRMVYSALGAHMQNEIHALSLKTFTPAEIPK